jgi:hypothetical protein
MERSKPAAASKLGRSGHRLVPRRPRHVRHRRPLDAADRARLFPWKIKVRPVPEEPRRSPATCCRDRLKRLVELGVLEKNAYSTSPPRYDYQLTEKGRDFAPALVGLKDWGKRYMPVRKPAAA